MWLVRATACGAAGSSPSRYQGIEFRSQGDPVLFLSNPEGIGTGDRRRIIDSINHLNRIQLADVGDPEIATRINQYEMAYRMQASVPELMDTSSEPAHIHEMYGTQPGKPSFANNCLLARRLVERGVRFVQLFDQGWDHHGSVFPGLQRKCRQVRSADCGADSGSAAARAAGRDARGLGGRVRSNPDGAGPGEYRPAE